MGETDVELTRAVRSMLYEYCHTFWEGDYGRYPIPKHLLVRMRRDGWPDMRCKGAQALLDWAKEQEETARNGST